MDGRAPIILLLVMLMTIVSGCEFERKDYSKYDSWDEDGDFVIDDTEFSDTYPESGLLNAWDKDSNERINRKEFTASSYIIWDADNDGTLESNEWSAASNFYLSKGNYENRGEFSYWDTNHDSILAAREFSAFSDSLKYFEEYDVNNDNELDRSEFSSLLFKIYDIDGDGILQENEFSALNESDESKN